MSIKLKIAVPMVILVIVTVIATMGFGMIRFTGYINDSNERSLESAAALLTNQVEKSKTSAAQAGQLIAHDADLIAYIISGNRDDVVTRAGELQRETGVDFVTVLDPSGIVIARPHEPDNFGDSLANQQNISAAISGVGATVIETGSAIRLSIRSSSILKDDSGNTVGIVSVGFRLDQDGFVDSVKEITGSEVTVFLNDERISTTVEQADGTRAVGTTATLEVWETVSTGNPYIGHTQVVGKDADVKYMPLIEGDTVIGMLFVGLYTQESDAEIRNFMIIGILIGVLIIAVAIVASLVIATKIISPIRSLVSVAESISAGDVRVEVANTSNDETKQLSEAFVKIISSNLERSMLIQKIADGDYTVEVPVLSDKDVVGQSLEKMVETGNLVFGDISMASSQVASGSVQIADGAQALATGSTEQAATIEEFSATINEIKSQAQENSELAQEALSETHEAGRLMSDSLGNMSKLVQAMNKIDASSQDIAKVIKVIDDIAFQTNILALNAAVEAARAGTAGKGFAVVADEVRNLAAKSATAASETTSLINASVDNVTEGTELAKVTSESLHKVGELASANAQKMTVLSEASINQSESVGLINDGIGQISIVVQSNSATAEQSAAAAQEMSAQSALLNKTVTRFKIKNSSPSTTFVQQNQSPHRRLGQ